MADNNMVYKFDVTTPGYLINQTLGRLRIISIETSFIFGDSESISDEFSTLSNEFLEDDLQGIVFYDFSDFVYDIDNPTFNPNTEGNNSGGDGNSGSSGGATIDTSSVDTSNSNTNLDLAPSIITLGHIKFNSNDARPSGDGKYLTVRDLTTNGDFKVVREEDGSYDWYYEKPKPPRLISLGGITFDSNRLYKGTRGDLIARDINTKKRYSIIRKPNGTYDWYREKGNNWSFLYGGSGTASNR